MPQDQHHIKRGLTKENRSDALPGIGKSWFFGVGINRYKHFPNLNNAVKDVEDLILLLESHYDLEPENVITLFDEAATRRNIIGTFDQLVKNVGPQDKLLIYYSGHGHLNAATKKKRGFWIPTDAEKDHTDHYIRNTVVREYIDDIDSLHTLLISDSCFSGSIFVRDAGSPNYAIRDLAQRKSRWAICSGRHDEQVFDGDPGTNSPFAAGLMYLLKKNNGQYLNVAKLADEVVHLTRANYEQLPEGNPMYGVGHMGGQYVFTRKNASELLTGQQPETVDLRSQNTHTPAPRKPDPGWNRRWLIGAGIAIALTVTALMIWGTGAGQKEHAGPPLTIDMTAQSIQAGENQTKEETILPPTEEDKPGTLEKETGPVRSDEAATAQSDPVKDHFFQYTIKGFIKEESDSPVPGVKILLEGEVLGTSDENGFFQVNWQGAKKKLVSLRYEKNGYRPFTEDIKIGAGDIDGNVIDLTTLTVKLKKDNSSE